MKNIYCKWSDYAKNHQEEYLNKFGWKAFYKKDTLEDNFVLTEYVMKLASIKDKFLYWFYGFYHQILEVIHFIPTYNELDSMDYGWRKNFGIDFCTDLKEALLKDGGWKYMLKEFRIIQIKEKYGEFTFYPNYYTENVKHIIDLYEGLSKYVCIDCGNTAIKRTVGYICPYCNDCYNKSHKGEYFKYISPKTEYEIKHNKEVDEMIDKC